jgi:hypothetical protein
MFIAPPNEHVAHARSGPLQNQPKRNDIVARISAPMDEWLTSKCEDLTFWSRPFHVTGDKQ